MLMFSAMLLVSLVVVLPMILGKKERSTDSEM